MAEARRSKFTKGRRLRHSCILSALPFLIIASSPAYSPGPLQSMPQDSQVIALVGTIPITVREFEDGFEFAPAFVRKLKDPKGSYLEFLINEKLLALQGYANKHDTIGTVRRLLTEIGDDLAVTQWYKEEVMPRVSLDSVQVDRALGQDNTNIRFRFVFSRDRGTMEALSGQLSGGVTFDSLYSAARDAEGVIVDEVPTTLFSAVYHNPPIAAAIAHQAVGTTSDIIGAEDGYYLVHLDRVSMNAVITASEYRRRKLRMEARLRQEAADSVAAGFIKGLMERYPPTLRANAISTLQNELVRALKTGKGEGGISELRMLDQSEAVFPHGESEALRKVLVDSERDRLTVGDFVEWYRLRRYPLEINAPPQVFHAAVKGLVWRMVRDKRLIALARRKGYHSDPAVIRERKLWADKLVYWQERRRIRQSVHIDDKQFGAFLQKYGHRYGVADSTGVPAAEDVLARARNELMSIEGRKAVLYALNALRQKFNIAINANVLTGTQVSSESVSRPIEIFLTRPGATLPRQAFPTIDRDWQIF